jgi:copper transport protein
MTLSCRRLWLPLARGIILPILLWLCMAVTAHAHASLHMTEPRDGSVVAVAPASIKLFFSEPVSPTRLMITMPDGSSAALERFVANGRVVEIEPPADPAKGTYLVSWRVVSEDGHPVAGTIVFSIGEPQATQTGTQDAVDWSVRLGLWLGRIGLYIGLLPGVGGVFAIHIFCRGSKTAAPVVRIMLIIGILGLIASVGFQGLDTIGQPMEDFFRPDVWQAGLATSFGRTAAIAVVALALAGFALKDARPKAAWIAAGALVAAALAPSLSGHAGTAEPQWVMRAVVFAHAAGAAIWGGALMPLAAEVKSGSAGAAASLRRFSRWIPLVVLVLAASGGALVFVQVRTVQGLWTGYGSVLMIKLGLLVPLFALAAFNRWRLTSGATRGEPGATATLVRVIVVETVLVLAVLGAVAAWRFTPPPRSTVAEVVEPEVIHLHSEQAMAMLTVRKDPEGRSTLSASITAADLSPLAAQEVRFVLSNPAAGIEPITRQATKAGATEWTVAGLALPVTGPWTIRIDIFVDDFTLYSVEGEIDPAL